MYLSYTYRISIHVVSVFTWKRNILRITIFLKITRDRKRERERKGLWKRYLFIFSFNSLMEKHVRAVCSMNICNIRINEWIMNMNTNTIFLYYEKWINTFYLIWINIFVITSIFNFVFILTRLLARVWKGLSASGIYSVSIERVFSYDFDSFISNCNLNCWCNLQNYILPWLKFGKWLYQEENKNYCW